jgi:putative endonuclease
MKNLAVYILTSKRSGTLYTGVTSNLAQRIYQHKNNIMKGFTFKYSCKLLELFDGMYEAIVREKQIKAGSRLKKLMLVESINPNWIDLYDKICI